MPDLVVTPSRGESLVIWRRRNGLSQKQAAQVCGVSPDRYREWESGNVASPKRYHAGQLTPQEMCILLRRRKGWTQEELARRMGCTRTWIQNMETGKAPADRLRTYWGV